MNRRAKSTARQSRSHSRRDELRESEIFGPRGTRPSGDSVECAGQTTLKDVFKDDFYIGAALSLSQIFGKEPDAIALVKKHFNTVTPENILKWEEVHPEPNQYNFEGPDRYVAFGEKHKMHIIGHTLVWFHQTPDWVFQD